MCCIYGFCTPGRRAESPSIRCEVLVLITCRVSAWAFEPLGAGPRRGRPLSTSRRSRAKIAAGIASGFHRGELDVNPFLELPNGFHDALRPECLGLGELHRVF